MIDIQELEKAFLGNLLHTPNQITDIKKIQAGDFKSAVYGQIFNTILKQWREGTDPTITTLCHELKDLNPADIAELTSVHVGNVGYYEEELYQASRNRRFTLALHQAQEDQKQGIDTDAVIKNLLPALAGVTNARNETKIQSAAALLTAQFPPIRWVIPDLIGEGLTLFVGSPKVGKSWFSLNLAIAASSGGRFLGEIETNTTDTLYLALEDTERRLHDRLIRLSAPALENLHITTQWRDGYLGLENYLKAQSGIGLVIIDTLARFASIDDMNDYTKTTTAMARLKGIADDLNRSLLVIHHTKKGNAAHGDWMEAALGSTGLTGAADSTLFIHRDRKADKTENTATLHATGRDTADSKHRLKLDLDCGGWIITGEPPPSTKAKPQILTRAMLHEDIKKGIT